MDYITALARRFGLARSTLLYYDRIGLLAPSGRSAAGYRLYSAADCARLETICALRGAGIEIKDIHAILAAGGDENSVLRRRLAAIGAEIAALASQQRLIAGMLKLQGAGGPASAVDKEMFVEMLRAAGMDEAAMRQLHVEFERRQPQAHHAFLVSLGIAEQEVLLIRKWSAEGAVEQK